jgi:hypothetical protein
MYKAYHKVLPINLQILFSDNANSQHHTRQRENFKQNYVRTTKKQMCLSSYGVILWNSLDANLKSSENLKLFKYRYKRWLICEYDIDPPLVTHE